MIHTVFHHLQYSHGYFIINISGNFCVTAGYFYHKFFFQFSAHHLCQTIHLRDQSLEIGIRDALFAFSCVCDLITGAFRFIIAVHMSQKILDTTHYRPAKIRHIIICFQTTQFPFQKTGNHTQQLQDGLQIFLCRRIFLTQIRKQILRRMGCFRNDRISHHRRRTLDAVHGTIQTVYFFFTYFKFFQIRFGFDEPIDLIDIFPAFFQKNILQKIGIFYKLFHFINLLAMLRAYALFLPFKPFFHGKNHYDSTIKTFLPMLTQV